MARARRGTKFDPEVVDAFCAAAPEVLAGLPDELDLGAEAAANPHLRRPLPDDGSSDDRYLDTLTAALDAALRATVR